MRTVATFESNKFNLTEHRDYFINQGCYGDDLGRWLIRQLRAAGAETDSEPGQEDFGWYVNYTIHGQPFCSVIGNVGGEYWFVTVERVTGFIGSVQGWRNRNVSETGIMQLHQIFSSSLMWRTSNGIIGRNSRGVEKVHFRLGVRHQMRPCKRVASDSQPRHSSLSRLADLTDC